MKIGIVGFGHYSFQYMDIWMKHPLIEKVVGAEFLDERRKEAEDLYGIKTYKTYEEMLEFEPELDAVAIFTGRHLHGPMVIKALKLGKHVFSAVPMGVNEEEVCEILRLVKETRLIYMMAETCYYFPCSVWCREQYKQGKFGKFQYGESQYYHDISEMYDVFYASATKDKPWQWFAGIPPMFYSTHSTSMLYSVINERPVEVSCYGIRDNYEDKIYGEDKNEWGNPYSNQTALVRMSGGGVARINEFRRIGTTKPSSYLNGLYGDLGAYEYSGAQHLFSRNVFEPKEFTTTNVSDEINSFNWLKEKDNLDIGAIFDYKYHRGFSPCHNYNRLPKELLNVNEGEYKRAMDGHNGSHILLVDDFVRAVKSGNLPPVDPWLAAYCTITGIYAHKSSMMGGVPVKIPDLGEKPADWNYIDYEDIKY